MAQREDGAGTGGAWADAARAGAGGTARAGAGRSTGDGALDDAPDTRLTDLLRSPVSPASSIPTASPASPASAAYPALRELRRRHHPAVLAYARLCAASESGARRLAAETFATAARETARGADPAVPLRHRLLLLTARLATAWAHDERSTGVDPGLLLVLHASGLPDGPAPPLLPAFRSLPTRDQGLIWYGVLEQEPQQRTAAYLGLSRTDVAYGIPQALKALSQACLRHRLAASDDPRCADFRRLIEEAVRPDGPRHSGDLDAHMARCPHCTAAFEDLRALRDTPRQTLAEGLLPWSGTAYLRAEEPPPVPEPSGVGANWPPRRRVLLASAALGVALTPLLVFLLVPDRKGGQEPTAATPAPPPVTVTATVPVTPSPSLSPAPSRSTDSPPPGRTSPHPTAPVPAPTGHPSAPGPTPAPPGTAFAQVVNLATGRCLDIRDGDPEQGNDVVTAPCSGAATQRWRVDGRLGVVRSAADDSLCLDSRGATDRGVGVWGCDSVHGDHGDNLRFTVAPDGTIRPCIATGAAVTPAGRYGVSLEPLDGSRAQRWRAGAA
ncbi:RICIN domain-containing protein [Streptomyces sp. MMG1121]|uniref:RICIN domain-containing protein n=1 Tax=Streptomyces sp. MMG1121 TaxID=1415544 RepID=UPI0006C2B6D6|nr:RICIN domain-containing protein [Streptomyces sp. MMG1121]KOV63200.1 ricin-type beta-trefoil lectin domain protein [Streptomyces sp. MMG1121]